MNTTLTVIETADDVQGHFLPLIALGVGLLVAGCKIETTNVNININSPGSTQTNANPGSGSGSGSGSGGQAPRPQ